MNRLLNWFAYIFLVSFVIVIILCGVLIIAYLVSNEPRMCIILGIGFLCIFLFMWSCIRIGNLKEIKSNTN